MIYQSAKDWLGAPEKRVLLFGMSGLGKTHISQALRRAGGWFHYSVDYRIGTRYLGETITDNAKREAMKVPFLRELLMSDSIYIGSNITFGNLAPVSSWLGKPGDEALGGLPMDEYRARQARFAWAERQALADTPHFIARAQELYGYPHFICDSGGSICEWVEPDNPGDDLMGLLSSACLLVWIRGGPEHTQSLIERFDKAPKPMAYQPQFLTACWEQYLAETGLAPARVPPDDFIRWTYARALAHRQPRYEAMAKWGVTVSADEAAAVCGEDDFAALIATALERRAKES